MFDISGISKPTSIEQAHLAGIVVDYVQRFVNQFTASDLIWVRSMKASKMGVLNCQCRTVQMASTVRSTFASLIKSANPPTYLGKISISFAHQIGTRVRLSILRSISRRQKDKEPNAICSISAFSARPLLQVGSKEQGTRFLSYVDAVQGFRHLLKQEDLDKALSLCTGLRGHLKSRFLVLSDDRSLPPAPTGRGKRAHPDSNIPGVTKRQNTSVPPPTTQSSASMQPGTSTSSSVPASSVPQYNFSSPSLPAVLGSIPGVSALAISSVPSPGAQFPPLGPPSGVVAVNDGFQKVKKRRPRKSKVDLPVGEPAKVPTPTRSIPPRQVKSGKPSLMDISSQDESERSTDGSDTEFVDAPPQMDA